MSARRLVRSLCLGATVGLVAPNIWATLAGCVLLSIAFHLTDEATA